MTKIIFSEEFKKKLNETEVRKQLSEHFDERMGRSLVIRYAFRYPFVEDIRKCFNQNVEEDAELLDYYKDYVDGVSDNDDKVLALTKAVNERLSYKSDKDNWGKIEYWASPIEVHRKKVDDCDGYAVLICYLLGLFGISSFRRFVRAGDVYDKSGNKFYHATAIYLSESRNEFFALEGSFYKNDAIKQFNDMALRENTLYGSDTWFITNEKDSYSTSRFRVKFVR